MATLDTPWTAAVGDTPHPEYPRPLMVRPEWTNLNGRWSFGVTPLDSEPAYDETILVPFAPECALSGIERAIPPLSALHYRRSFSTPANGDERTILHFEAVDWACEVWVDGASVGTHRGGYDPFCFDVTGALSGGGEHELVVRVEDPSDLGPQPRGKQVTDPGGIYYVATSGIWGTVWLEAVKPGAIRDLAFHTKNDGTVRVELERWPGGETADPHIELRDGGDVVTTGGTELRVPSPKLWSVDAPHLYGVTVSLANDTVDSYLGFREVGLIRDSEGRARLALNGEAVFQVGPLDQGYWPDGGLTPPTYEAMIFDVDETKRLGFNLIRKHVKVEPRTWYAYCDHVGILVWQDMPSGARNISPDDPDFERTPESTSIFKTEYEAMIRTLRNHPSVNAWVLFNEGWGQFDTANTSEWARSLDPSRNLVAVTGWCDRDTGDVHDWHVYPGPGAPMADERRASSLGEFGGLGLPVEGHMWQRENWGYRSYATKETLTAAFEEVFDHTRLLLRRNGLSAAIYTQTTDVETEANGLYTYDRRVLKMDADHVRKCVGWLLEEGPAVITLEPVAESRVATADGGERVRREYEIEAGEYATHLLPSGRCLGFLDGQPRTKIDNAYSLRYPNGPRLVRLEAGRHVLDAKFDEPGGQFALLKVERG